MEDRKIVKSKVLRIDDCEYTISEVDLWIRCGYVVLKMEKMNDCLWFHLVKYEE